MLYNIYMAVEVNGILVAAHELKAPLCLMRQLVLALGLAERPETKSHLYAQLVEVSERSMRQIEDLTKIARLEDSFFATEPVSVRGVCETVVREIEPLFQHEHRSLKFTYANRSRLAIANRDLLHSVVYNFCVNALRYSEDATLSQLTVQDHQQKIRISVRDYGPALPNEIYQCLQSGRLDQPTQIAMRPGSSGLGLYIASEFARHMQAKIGAIRHRDGTSFYVDLPISKQATLAL